MNNINHSSARLFFDVDTMSLRCEGVWTLQYVDQLQAQFAKLPLASHKKIVMQGSPITKVDTAGVLLIYQMIKQLEASQHTIELAGFTADHLTLFNLVKSKEDALGPPLPPAKSPHFLYQVGKRSIELAKDSVSLLNFVGQITMVLLNSLRRPSLLQFKAILNTIDVTGFRALPIIALLSFMIGVVLTYQMGLQLRSYGAEIYIVDLLGLSIFREFAPLITAIVVAGRTSSSFTAEIGTMKIQEEIDALSTMGINPIKLLVLPKIAGLIIALPLLSVWADLFGILGGMTMSNEMLHINPADFLMRFQHVVSLRHFLIGIGKAPVFALIIAVIGCFHGLQVRGSADSVGKQTTKSVVFSIFCIIVADAIFSILFSWQDI